MSCVLSLNGFHKWHVSGICAQSRELEWERETNDRTYEKERSGVSVTQQRIDAVEEFAGKGK